MALIKCPECGKEVSDTIERCIHCGYELKPNLQRSRCPECGKEVASDARLCPYCGYEIMQNSQLNFNERESFRAQRTMDETEVTDSRSDAKSTRATVGFILGLCSIIAWFIPLFGYPVTICGIVFSSKGIDSNRYGFAIAGLILSLIFFVITLINSIAGAVMYSSYY